MASLIPSKKSTGIYIGTSRIVVTEISRSFRKISLNKIAESDVISSDELKSDISPDESLSKFEETDAKSKYVGVLRRLLQENNFQTENVILVLPGRRAMIRYFTLPNLSKHEIASAVKFEAKKYIPFKLDEVETDYHINRSVGLNKEVGILFAAVKKDLLQEKLSILDQCNIKPKDIKISSLSLLNVIYKQQGSNIEKNKSYGIIDVNEQVATITIFKEGVPYLIRDFSLSGSEFQSTSISGEDYENFLHELHLSMEYYYGQPDTTNIDKLFLFDDGTLRDKVSGLNSEFNIPVVQPDISNIVSNFYTGDVSFQGMLSIITVVDDFLKSKINIAISSKSKQDKLSNINFDLKNFSIAPRLVLVEIIGFLIAALVFYVVMDRKILASIQEEVDKVIEKRRSFLNDSDANLSKDALNEILIKTTNKENLLTSILYDRVYLTDKLSRLAANLPGQMWFKSLKYENHLKKIGEEFFVFYIQGAVFVESKKNSMDIISKFIRDLKNDPIFLEGFSEIKLVSVTKGVIRGFPIANFKIICR